MFIVIALFLIIQTVTCLVLPTSLALSGIGVRQAIEDFFTLNDPKRIPTVPTLLSEFAGRERALLESLEVQYGLPVVQLDIDLLKSKTIYMKAEEKFRWDETWYPVAFTKFTDKVPLDLLLNLILPYRTLSSLLYLILRRILKLFLSSTFLLFSTMITLN